MKSDYEEYFEYSDVTGERMHGEYMKILADRLEDAVLIADQKRQEYEAAKEDVVLKKRDLDIAWENKKRENRDKVKRFPSNNNNNSD